ncbi:MAG: PDZ domain-containing protein, partial [Gammaproteobacteria bacterium]|nr:serine protease [Gemmatimonadota bacterium]NIU72489.1 PDZ domain-containing protein [Gammaproteobacteria bacterium]
MYIPVDTLKRVLAELLLNGRTSTRRPWLGLYCEEIDGTVRVMRVPDDGPAASAGIRSGDEVVAVAGRSVASLPELYRAIWAVVAPGGSV